MTKKEKNEEEEVDILEDYLQEINLKGYRIPNKKQFQNEEHSEKCVASQIIPN